MSASYRLAMAPRFSSVRSFQGRVERNGGTERQGERFVARDGWTPLEASELSAVTAPAPAPTPDVRPDDIAFFQIPERLRAAWWTEAEREGASGSAQPHQALEEILEFLRFKRLPLPDRVGLRVQVSAPDLPSTRIGPQSGLGFDDPPPVASINLGDEASWVVLLPLPPFALAERLDRAGVSLARAATPPELAARFFEVFPERPLLRFRLEPGEGLWFPPEGLIHDGWTAGRTELDVVLHLAPEPVTPPPAPDPLLREIKESP